MSDVIGAGNTPTTETFTPIEELSYEEAREELLEVVKILELGQMPLDESLAYWERGEALAGRCEEFLAGAQKRVQAVVDARRRDELTDDERTANDAAGLKG